MYVQRRNKDKIVGEPTPRRRRRMFGESDWYFMLIVFYSSHPGLNRKNIRSMIFTEFDQFVKISIYSDGDSKNQFIVCGCKYIFFILVEYNSPTSKNVKFVLNG